MKKFLLILLVIVLLAVGGIGFLFYRSIDEESFKQQIIASTKELTGNEMIVSGEVKVQLFPSPIIRLNNVIVKNKAAFKTPDLIKIAAVEAHVRFSSLLKDPLIIDNVILTEPEVFLERNEKGENNWQFSFLNPNQKAISKDDLLGQTFSDIPPQFQNMEIEKGAVTYKNVLTGRDYKLTDIDVKITSSSITGPFDVTGQLKDGTMPLNVTLHVDKLNANTQSKFTLSLLNPSSQAVLSIQNGQIEKLGNKDQSFSGNFTFNVPKLSPFLQERKGIKNLPEPLNQSVIGNGSFLLNGRGMTFSDIAARYGDKTGEASMENAVAANISFVFPTKVGEKGQISTDLRFSHLNLDIFTPYISKPNSWQNILDWIDNAFTQDIDMVINAGQITLFNQTIKDAVFSADKDGKTIEVREIKATLPENTAVEANGEVLLGAADQSIQLGYTLQSQAPQKTLDWLKIAKMPVDLKNVADLKLTSQLRVRPKDLTFTDIDMTADGASIKGAVAFALTEPKLTGYVDLNMSNVNVDNFLPYNAPEKARTMTQWVQDVENTLRVSPLLSDVNLDLKIAGNDITYKNLPMEQVTYQGKIADKNWTTDSLKISQAAMSNIEFSGSIQKLADNSIYFKDILIDLEMPKSLLLLDRLKIESPFSGNVSKVDLKSGISGSFDKLNINSDIMFTQGRIQLQGTIEQMLGTSRSYTMTVKANHPNFHQFMRLFNPNFKQLPTLSGNFVFNGTLKGVPEQLSFINTDLSIGAQRLSGNLELSRTENGIKANGTIASPYLYMDKFFSGKGFVTAVNARTGKSQFSQELLNLDPLNDLSLNLQLSAEKIAFGQTEFGLFNSHIVLDNRILMIQDTKATMDGGAVELSSILNYSTATPFIKGTLKMDKVPLRADVFTLGLFRLKSGNTSLMLDFDTRGNSIDDMVNALSSTGRFTIQNGAISSLNLNAFERRIRTNLARQESLNGLTEQLNKELTVGETAFDSLEGSFAVTNGVFRTSDTVLRTADANAIIQMNFDMPEWQVSASAGITLKNFTGYPPISVVVKGMAHNPQTNIDFASFVNHVESASTDVKNKLLLQEQAQQAAKARKEASGRISQISTMYTKAEESLAKAEETLRIETSPAMQNELIRAKDAFVLLQQLAQKTAPSVADVEKASAQSSLVMTRTATILREATQKAAQTVRTQIQQIDAAAQEKMHAIHRIEQRLAGVEAIEQAYQKAFSTMTLIQQLKSFAEKSVDLEKLRQALKQATDALDIMELTYESIAKFDVDAGAVEQQSSSTVSGSIRRN